MAPIYLARIRMPLVIAGLALLVSERWHAVGWLGVVGFAMVAVGLVLLFLPVGAVRRPAVHIGSPLSGRWLAVHSPTDRVPSHGTHELGQTYAVDLVHQPDPAQTWRGVRAWPLMSPPQSFPSFGHPIMAVADAEVVRASDWQRDHLSRNSLPGILYLLVEGLLRSVLGGFGARFVLGNHVVLRLDEGVFATYAHLRRGSASVRKGDRVTAGQQLAKCGNSGNSSEPHLHFQLTDTPALVVAAGLPFAFDYDDYGGDYGDHAQRHHGVPRNLQPFTVDAQTAG